MELAYLDEERTVVKEAEGKLAVGCPLEVCELNFVLGGFELPRPGPMGVALYLDDTLIQTRRLAAAVGRSAR